MAIVTVEGSVTKAITDSRMISLKETYLHSYTPAGGETVSKTATRYWTVWMDKPHTLNEGTVITVTGTYSTVSGEAKADGKVCPNHKLNNAYIGQDPAVAHATPLTKAEDLLTQLSDVPF